MKTKIWKFLFLIPAMVGSLLFANTQTAQADANETVNVTIPSQINISYDEQGKATVSDLQVQNNNSYARVILKNVQVDEVADMHLVAWGQTSDDDTNISLRINGQNLTAGSNVYSIEIPKSGKTDLNLEAKDHLFKQTINNKTAFTFAFHFVFGQDDQIISFDTQGGSTIEPWTYKNGSTIQLPNVSSTSKVGYILSGWKINGETKAPGSDYVVAIGSNELQAVWTPITYHVRYHGNNATTGTMGDSDHVYDTASNLAENQYRRTGYTFLGWSTREDASQATYTDGQSISNLTSLNSGYIDLYAVWQANTYTVTFDTQGGTPSSGTMKVTYDAAYGTLPQPNKEEYVFDGWYTQPEGGTKIEANTIVSITQDQTLYAHWKQKQAFAVYSADDGSLDFYKRADVPAEGTQFEGKTATKVFTGVEDTEDWLSMPWEPYYDNILMIDVIDPISPNSTKDWFLRAMQTTHIDVSKLDMSHVTNMQSMFEKAGQFLDTFEIIGLEDFDTSNVTNMNYVFYLTGSMANDLSLGDISGWNTSKVEHISGMFNYCGGSGSAGNLDIGDLSNWDLSNAKNLSYMFAHCPNINTTITISSVESADNYEHMFDSTAVNDNGRVLVKYVDDKTKELAKQMVATNENRGHVYLYKYDITYDTDGGTLPEDAPTDYLTGIGLETLPTPVKNGYGFTGWKEKVPIISYSADSASITYDQPFNGYYVTNLSNDLSSSRLSLMRWYNPLQSTATFSFNNKEKADLDILLTDVYNDLTGNQEGFFKIELDGVQLAENVDSAETVVEPGSHVIKISYFTEYQTAYYANIDITNVNEIEAIPSTQTGDIDLTATWKQKQAFAVYSADDNSLNFYKRTDVPSIGDTFEDKTVTNVYTGFENATYINADQVPWSSVQTNVTNVTVVDEGIHPISTAYWLHSFSSLNHVDLSKLDTSKVTDMSYMFYNAGFDASSWAVDLSMWNTSEVTNMSYMFQGSGQRSDSWSVNLSNWDTSKVTDMSGIFAGAGFDAKTWSVVGLDNWNTSSVTNMKWLFMHTGTNYATTWSVGDLSNWDTSKVTNMSFMFQGAGQTATAWSVGNLSNWKTGNVTNMNSMFNRAGQNATTWYAGDFSNWDTSKVTNMYNMFADCSQANTSITIRSTATTSYDSMFQNAASADKAKIIVKYVDDETKALAEKLVSTKNEGDHVYLWEPPTTTLLPGPVIKDFLDVNELEFTNTAIPEEYKSTAMIVSTEDSVYKAYLYLGQDKWYISPEVDNCTIYANEDSSEMFANSYSISKINFANFNTSKVKNMNHMFSETGTAAESFELTGLQNWDTSQVTDMSYMFYSSGNTVSSWNIDSISSWNTSNVTDMSYMFYDAGNSAENWSIDVQDWNTSNVKNMSYMFSRAGQSSDVWNINVSKWNTSQVTDMSHMFESAGELSSQFQLDLSQWKTGSVTDMSYMFALTATDGEKWSVGDLSNWNTDNVTNMSNMFEYAGSNVSQWNVGDLSNWNTIKVRDMSSMFYYCQQANTSITIRSVNTTAYNNMFYFAASADNAQINVKYTDNGTKAIAEQMVATKNEGDHVYLWEPPAVTLMTGSEINPLIRNLSNLEFTTTAIPEAQKASATVVSAPDSGYKAYLYTVNGKSYISPETAGLTIYANEDSSMMFGWCKSMSTIQFSNFDTSKVKNMSYMFSNSSFTSLDLSVFDTSNVTDMSGMFASSRSLTSVMFDLSKFNTANVQTMDSMFEYCTELNSLSLVIRNANTTYANMFNMSAMTGGHISLYYDKTECRDVVDMMAQTNMFGAVSNGGYHE